MNRRAIEPAGRANALRRATHDVIGQFRARRPMRAGSLVITVFGDAIAPHGGTVWLGSLIRALGPFGVNQRLVRTSVFRLARDGWFSSEQIGRRSYYSLTAVGARRFEEASRHIYSPPRQQWSGNWCLVLLANVPTPQREEMRRELGWLGFAPFSANVLAHPDPDLEVLEAHLRAIEGHEQAVVFDAAVKPGRETEFDTLIQRAWSLEKLRSRYEQFVDNFQPVLAAARRERLDAELAFHIRTLLVHEYRRIVLRDPLLPAALLPGGWTGFAAYELCRDLYRRVTPASEKYLTEHMETATGSLPRAAASFYARFGGLRLAAAEDKRGKK